MLTERDIYYQALANLQEDDPDVVRSIYFTRKIPPSMLETVRYELNTPLTGMFNLRKSTISVEGPRQIMIYKIYTKNNLKRVA